MEQSVISEGVVSEGGMMQEGTIVEDGSMISEEPMYESEPIIEQPHAFTSEEIQPALPAEPNRMPKPATPVRAPEPEDNGLELFDNAPSEPMTPPPAQTPAAKEATDLPPQEPAESPAAPAQPTEPADTGMDDMFNEMPSEEAPAEEPVKSDEPSDVEENLDDLFGSLNTRKWTDDTGRYSTEGRLASIGAGAIRIFKTNGHYCTVTYDRLSHADFEYVQFIAKKSGKASVLHLAAAR